MLENGSLTRREYRRAIVGPRAAPEPGNLYTRIREPYFFSFVRQQLADRYGERKVQSGGLRVYTTIDPRLQRLAERAIRDTLYDSTDPAAAIVSIDPRTGAIRAMTGVIPGQDEEPVQPGGAGEAAGRVDLQDLRADHGRCAGHRPVVDVVPVGAVPLRHPGRDRRLGRLDVRPFLPRLRLDRACDALAPTTPCTRA